MIEIEGITKRYDETTVVDDVSMVIEPRTVSVIVGTSGSGKTTLLRMINRLVEPTAGVIKLDGNDNRSLPGYELRRSIGYAIQGHGLFPHRTVAQNIGLATIAALIGGGGFGVFVFQGVGQTAMDLVLLGAVPTVALAFAAAIILDAVIEMTATKRRVETA